ncbi:Sugar-specific transcriptional regulator TrmB [Streptomyces sp. OV198]|jgi:DNA-binding CsgD family transcriptional regulator/sugar-specific transcriptional regulator TrmB|uniref:helix-turn-helix transcriptional regulator n=1 Tax=Streptomyces sp. OV198 TaxID=1882787 RepID=UPI000BDDD69A|nr:LuxR C-terminal-related transcriptional regulator [Streptomyces sp. OV198]SOF02418.1 Sugar-specific transcriptional regulator TrmB [Streptomyces sp. OV198]
MDVTSDSPWASLGLDWFEGQLLEHLVGSPPADVVSVAQAAGVSTQEAERTLQRLEEASLVIRIAGRPARWTVSPPRSSLGGLLARRRTELARTEELAERLYAAYEAASASRTAHLVEVLQKGEETAARYAQLLRSSNAEVLHLAKPPYVTADRASSPAPEVAAGVRLRSVYETEGFTDAVSLETASRGTADGGELRLASHLPTKLVVFDRTSALLPVRPDRPTAGSLVVHSFALVAALAALFERVWDQAVPAFLGAGHDRPVPAGGAPTPRPDERTREVLRLMATGMKDDSIARALGISRRTVQKHVSDAGTALGAKTRFQIGLLAAERGWLGRRP